MIVSIIVWMVTDDWIDICSCTRRVQPSTHTLIGLSSQDGVLPSSSMDRGRGGADENKLITLQVRKHFVHVHTCNYSLNGNFL